jgi:hypothetical protein
MCIRDRVEKCCDSVADSSDATKEAFYACVEEEVGDVNDGECWLDNQGGGCFAGCNQVYLQWRVGCASCRGNSRKAECLETARFAHIACYAECTSSGDWDSQQGPDDMLDKAERALKKCRKGFFRRLFSCGADCGGSFAEL